MDKPKPESKTFGLKPLEMRMLEVMQNRHQEEFGNFLTFISSDRLAYTVTPNTRFRVEQDKLIITEEEPKEEAKAGEEVATA